MLRPRRWFWLLLLVCLPARLTAADTDREVAEWVVQMGGQIHIMSQGSYVRDPPRLPMEPFTLRGVLFVKSVKPLTDDDLIRLAGLKELQWLLLRNAAITDSGFAHLRSISTLADLTVARAPISDAELVHLKSLPQMTSLSLLDTKVSDDGLAHLAEMHGLKRLCLDDNPGITGTGFKHLANLAELKFLTCMRTTTTAASLSYIRKLPKLTWVQLSEEQSSDEGLAILADMDQLTQIALTGSKFTPQDSPA